MGSSRIHNLRPPRRGGVAQPRVEIFKGIFCWNPGKVFLFITPLTYLETQTPFKKPWVKNTEFNPAPAAPPWSSPL